MSLWRSLSFTPVATISMQKLISRLICSSNWRLEFGSETSRQLSSLLYGSFAKETYQFEEPTNRSDRCEALCNIQAFHRARGGGLGSSSIFKKINEPYIWHYTCGAVTMRVNLIRSMIRSYAWHDVFMCGTTDSRPVVNGTQRRGVDFTPTTGRRLLLFAKYRPFIGRVSFAKYRRQLSSLLQGSFAKETYNLRSLLIV